MSDIMKDALAEASREKDPAKAVEVLVTALADFEMRTKKKDAWLEIIKVVVVPFTMFFAGYKVLETNVQSLLVEVPRMSERLNSIDINQQKTAVILEYLTKQVDNDRVQIEQIKERITSGNRR